MSDKKTPFVMNELTGSLFTNDRRTTESQAHMKGSCMIDGVKYWISAWSKTTAKGTRMLSLKFTNADDLFPLGTGNLSAKPPMPDDEVPF